MAVPKGMDDPSSCERAELVICVPADWFGPDLSQLAGEGKAWPIEILKFAARFPHLYDSWLWIGHTLATEEPPEPFDPSTEFCAFAVGVPLGFPKEKWKMAAHDGRLVSFLTIIPLYSGELRFALDKGFNALLDLFDEAGVNELLDPTRPSLVPGKPPKRISHGRIHSPEKLESNSRQGVAGAGGGAQPARISHLPLESGRRQQSPPRHLSGRPRRLRPDGSGRADQDQEPRSTRP